MPDAIRVENLTKVYGKLRAPRSQEQDASQDDVEAKLSEAQPGGVVAVDNINVQVSEGEIFGFIGPNGAGKTTTIKMLLGLLFPTSGTAEILGKPAGDIEVKERISYLPESPYFYDHMTGAEMIDFYCRLFRIGKQDRKTKTIELLQKVGLGEDGGRRLREYSKGMLQRIGIAQALINDPDVLFFDEPTSGLDPIAHKDIQDTIVALRDEGKTVFLSSHQLSDVEMVCDRVAIINRGVIVKTGTLDELLHVGRTVITLHKPKDDLAERVKAHAQRVTADGDRMRVYVESEEQVHQVLDLARESAQLVSVVPQRQSLEDLFVEIVREARK